MNWHPASWREKPATHLPVYRDEQALTRMLDTVARSTGVVTFYEIGWLQQKLAAVAEGKARILHTGDCAEVFSPDHEKQTMDTLRSIFEIAAVLEFATDKPVVRIGRLAGQFAKPRSSPTETCDGVCLPSYMGDAVNDRAFNPEAREPEPGRLVTMMVQSREVMRQVRLFGSEGKKSRNGGVFTSHEALLLPYEQMMVRRKEDAYWSASAHLLWVGHRTNREDHAHVEFCRGLTNPLAMKVGPDMTADRLLRLIDLLDPENTPGRLTLIARYGARKIADVQRLMETTKTSGCKAIWISDPMHGNTETLSDGRKTRWTCKITKEVVGFIEACRAAGVHMGGLHLETSGQDVTECMGGNVWDLGPRYETACDPRLNPTQAMNLMKTVARWL